MEVGTSSSTPKRSKTTVSIIGNIGAGKSTLIVELKKHKEIGTKSVLVPEDVGSFKVELEAFYNDQKKGAEPLQTAISKSNSARLSQATTYADALPDCLVIISERSNFDTFHTFVQIQRDAGNLRECFVADLKSTLHVPEYLFYLDTPPSVCFDRIKTRNRPGEENIQKDYLDKLDTKHIELAKRYTAKGRTLIDPKSDRSLCSTLIDPVTGSTLLVLDHGYSHEDMITCITWCLALSPTTPILAGVKG